MMKPEKFPEIPSRIEAALRTIRLVYGLRDPPKGMISLGDRAIQVLEFYLREPWREDENFYKRLK